METAGWMRHTYDAVIAHQVERYGDTIAVRRKAAMPASQTDEHVNALIEAKLARPEMSRDELKTHLDHLRSQTR
jgi:hypothetical protein